MQKGSQAEQRRAIPEQPCGVPKRAFLRKVVGVGLIATGIAGLTLATGGVGGAVAAASSLAAASHGGATLAGGLAAVSLLRKIVGNVREIRHGVSDLEVGDRKKSLERGLGD